MPNGMQVLPYMVFSIFSVSINHQKCYQTGRLSGLLF